ncbi:hypothetical protein IWW48_000202 [Coemansia sp. RSA 1200]|nr:hypothetical protein IWW48_000202 [Coemansia sp. RSA 1200]
MRVISLSSRLQWAFRGSVLPGALATGDVDNDGCKEFIVGSAQGELAIFRGRGGCGSWRHSEDQIQPEYDCWDAVSSGQIPPELLTHLSSESASLRRQSTYNSLINGPASNRGSFSVDDILHLFEGGEQAHAHHAGSMETSDEETGYAVRRPSSLFDADFTDHIKWEDALDIERDGRKPWILAQRLGTISSVVVADIANCGHNSIVVVNGEGKCFVFDYPFKRKLHPEMRKRRRQRNHYRRFSLERFFKDGVVADSPDHQTNGHDVAGGVNQPATGVGADVAHSASANISHDISTPAAANGAISAIMNSPSLGAIGSSLGQPQLARVKTALSEFPHSSAGQNTNNHKQHTNSKSTPTMRGYDNEAYQLEPLDLRPLGELALATQEAKTNVGMPTSGDMEGSSIAGDSRAGGDGMRGKSDWRSIISRVEAQGGPNIQQEGGDGVSMGFYEGITASSASSQPDMPLAILSKCDAQETGNTSVFAEGGSVRGPTVTHIPTSPPTAKSTFGFANGGISLATSNSSNNRQRYVSDAGGIDSSSMVYGDMDTESEQDPGDVVSDSDECTLLTPEEAADIEKMWGANVGKKSGDWFPFVLDSPDMTFNIPTNVEHAIVADIDSDGMNELVLTATDGFVYIFRVESSVKHEVKPTLTSLGMLSNIPTTLPSANVTGNGSPYLHMSAPRSPDASDLDFDDSVKQDGPVDYVAGTRQQNGADRQSRGGEAVRGENSETDQNMDSESASDLNLMNQLLKSLGDKAVDTWQRGGETAQPGEDDAVRGEAQESDAKGSAASTQRRTSTGRRMSISSRVRESFSGIVSGWDLSRRTSESCGHTANPSTEHSQAQTRNTSANSTNAHSRKPSLGDECGSNARQLSAEADAESSAANEQNESRHREHTQYAYANDNTTGETRTQRGRTNSVCIGALQAIPERRSGNTERVGAVSDVGSLAERRAGGNTGGDVARRLNGMHATRAANTSSLAPSRNGSISRSNAPSTRAHSRRGSIASLSSRIRVPSTMVQEPESTYTMDMRYGNSSQTSRRGSISSNISIHEISAHGNGNPTQPAVPLEAAVSAKGSFSKPIFAHSHTNAEATDDNNSVISQVTERLAELNFKPGFKQSVNDAGGVNTLSRYNNDNNNSKGKGNVSYFDDMDREALGQLPPSRGIVDWSSTSVDKVATWFLDNIPGNVSIVTAPAEAFGAPVTTQGQALYSEEDSSSSYSCSTCDCSMCGSDSECGSEEFNSSPYRPETAGTTRSKGRAESIGYKVDLNVSEQSGVDLPKPLELDSLNKHISDCDVKGATAESDKASDSLEKEHLDSTERGDSGQKRVSGAGHVKDGNETVVKKNPQRFLILSKPGGRFVPIDMLNYAMLSTVEPPPVPMSAFTGCNTAHMMNVDTSNAVRNAQLAASLGMSLKSTSTADVLGTSGSYAYQLPSWQSGSMPWLQNIRSSSFGSPGHPVKSPVGIQGSSVEPYSQNSRHSSGDIAGMSSNRITEEPMVSQFPSSGDEKSVLGKSSESQEARALSQQFPAMPSSELRRSAASVGPSSVFHTSMPAAGGTSIGSNVRSIRSLHRVSSDGLRSQNFNAGHGPSPINRGMPLSGTMTPVGNGFPHAYNQYDRLFLGFAGLRGYIGNGINRQRSVGNPMTTTRMDESSFLSGYFTPFASAGQQSARPFSSGAGHGIGFGTMPREPVTHVFASSISTNASATNASGRAGALRNETPRQAPRVNRAGSATPMRNSASPQRGQHMTRYSPSMVPWSSYKEGPMLTAIRDREQLARSTNNALDNPRHGPMEIDNQAILETAPDIPRLDHDSSKVLSGEAETASPAAEIRAPVATVPDSAHHGFWVSTEPASARSHSSLGTGASGNYLPTTDDVKGEEEIEEAPQPVTMDVTTFMVGGVSAGKRLRRILDGPSDMPRDILCSTNPALSAAGGDEEDADGKPDDRPGENGDDSDESETEELVSLVSMDCVISCYDPRRKVSNFVGLSSKDPALGIWKIKMHEEIAHPSPLEAMLQDGSINLEDDAFGNKLVSSTPAKRIYRRVGLSRHDLVHAVQYASYIEERVLLLNKLENQRRRRARRMVRKVRSQTRLGGYGVVGEKRSTGGTKRDGSSPGLPKGSALWKSGKTGLNGRLRDSLTRYHRVGQTVRNLGNQLRELATSGSTQQSSGAADQPAAVLPVLTPRLSVNRSGLSAMQSEHTTPNLSLSPSTRRYLTRVHQQMHPSESKPASSDSNNNNNNKQSGAGESADAGGGRVHATSIDFTHPMGSGSAGEHLSSNAPGGGNTNANSLSNNLAEAANMRRAFSNDLAATLIGWYGENKNDFRRSLRVADHLVVSTWRGTTYFVDVGTIMDIASYNEMFSTRWSNSVMAASEAASMRTGSSYADVLAGRSENDASEAIDYQRHVLPSMYGCLSEFADISGLVSRLRTNASVIQFKFQDTVSAFLADTYAPATGGPSIPCLFYVDYKDRIWVYYHLDEISEMDDVYGATWLRTEPESLRAPKTKPRTQTKAIAAAAGGKAGLLGYGKPFSVVDLAYRRISQDPWFPLRGDNWFANVVSFDETSYPYSFRNWRKQKKESDGGCNNQSKESLATGATGKKPENTSASVGGTFYTHSNGSTNAIGMRTNANANATGSFHTSYVPSPYMCPIWSDINSVDIYDVGVCNLLELVAPELLAMKSVFCKDLGINPDTVDEKVALASIPGLAGWVRNCLYTV